MAHASGLLPLRRVTSTPSLCARCNQRIAASIAPSHTRTAATASRHRKMLNIAPSATFGGPTERTGGSGRSRRKAPIPEQDHIVFDPPASTPNVYHTPYKFLPKEDPRRALFTALPQSSNSTPLSSGRSTGSSPALLYQRTPTRLPPALTTSRPKQYHLTEEDIDRMRKLRLENEAYWTRERLAAEFKCSSIFVGMVVQASKQRLDTLQAQQDAVKDQWGKRRTDARDDRARRREVWARDG